MIDPAAYYRISARTAEEFAELRAWELALRIIARIQRESRFYHFWH